MRRLVTQSLTILLCGLVAPGLAFGGSLYIPLVGTAVDGFLYETEVTASAVGVDAIFTPRFIPQNTNGILAAEGNSVLVLSDVTHLSLYETGFLGMLEVETDSRLVWDARLVSKDNDQIGTQVPVISSRNAFPAGATAHLQGWLRDDVRITDFGLMNLGIDAAQCTIRVWAGDGTSLLQSFTATWQPLSIGHFPDALALLNQFEIADVRASVSCDRRFFPYAVTFDRATGEVRFIRPSASGATSLDTPSDCPEGAFCFEELGIVHAPQGAADNLKSFDLPLPEGIEIRRIQLQVDFVYGGKSNSKPNGQHMIFWIWRNRFRENTFGRLSHKGNKFQLFNNVNLSGSAQNVRQSGINLEVGATYHVVFIYDAQIDLKQATVSDDAGNIIGNLEVTTPISRIFTEGNGFEVRLGANVVDNVSNNPGWVWSDLKVQFIP